MNGEKWIDLSYLPRKGNVINWKESIGYKCKFKYDDIEGVVEIVDYISKNRELVIKYLDYNLYKIRINEFKKCKLGRLLKKQTNEFKIKIGQVFKDNKRDLIIIDREYRTRTMKSRTNLQEKWYKYHCNKCGNEDWITEGDIIDNRGCNVCCTAPKKAVLGINTIWDKARWMCDLGVSEEDAKKYTYGSHQEIIVKCPDCKREKKIAISNIYRNKTIFCICGDSYSYSEKFISQLLEQANVNYIKEYNQKWSNSKRYDFYFELSNKKYIIEAHGKQHYNKGFSTIGGRTLEEEQENDKLKKELALNNGIDYYIELDCRESNLDWIKNSVINSELNKIFDLNNIDWLKCEDFALSNRVKEICDYWHLHNETNNECVYIKDMSKMFNLSKEIVSSYLRKGNAVGWCNYNFEEHIKKCSHINGKYAKKNCKKTEIFTKSGESLGVFESASDLSRRSKELFGVELDVGHICSVATGERRQHKGFIFKYV